jgi:hypothetical protein
LFVCDLGEICLPGFSWSDPDDNIDTVYAIGGTLNGNSVCFTPIVGNNTIKLIVRDDGGLADTCTTVVNVTMNQPPVAHCPWGERCDTTIFVCSLDPICIQGFYCTDPDANLASCQAVGGTLQGDSVCFTPVAGMNQIKLIAVDECGAADTCTASISVTLNSPPAVACPGDTSLFLCTSDQVCLPGFSYSDPDNNITSVDVVGGTLNGNSICFMPVAGNTKLKITVTDACGEVRSCSTNVFVVFNSPPVCNVPANDTFFVSGDSTFSFSISATDVDDNLIGCTKVSGVGTFDGSTWTFTTSGQGTYAATFKCTDACGAYCSKTVSMYVTYNSAPVCNLPDDNTYFICDDTTFSFIVTATDIDNNLIGCTKLSGPGTLVDSIWTFTTNGPGIYASEFQCDDEGGASCYGMVNITVEYNSAPVCNVPDDAIYLVCDDTTFNFAVSASDVDDNLVGCSKVSGPGTFGGGTWSFSTSAPGVYEGVFECVDACGAVCRDTVNITINYNSPPIATCPNDTSIFVCGLDQLCLVGFTAADPDDNIVSQTVDNGTLNGNTVCFTPVEGLNTIKFTVTDACGAKDSCATNINVTLNSAPVASCPNDTTIFACDLSQICLPSFAASDVDGNITNKYVSLGTLSGDTVCFTPVEGTNIITFIVADACGESDTCSANITVNLNNPPVATCPWGARCDTTMFVCEIEEICLAGFSCSDPDGNLASCQAIGGTLNANSICFVPIEGHNYLKLIATDDCGLADTCEVDVYVELNKPPTASCPGDTVLFVCDLDQICMSGFIGSDPDDNIISRTTNIGALNGQTVCFTPVEGVNTIVFTVTDACNETDQCTTYVTVNLNNPPVANCPGDTSIFKCTLTEVYLPGFSCTDPDGNLGSCQVTGGIKEGNIVRFTPVEGLNTITLIATDECGLTDTCETLVTVKLNTPPTAECPNDTTLYVCDLSQVCISGFVGADPDDNITSTTASPGTLNGTMVCFTPVAGLNTIRFIVTDACGKADTCFTDVTVVLNSPPTVICPNDTSIFLCELEEICLPGFVASDPDDNITSLIVNPGSLNGNTVCFTPVEGLNTIRFIAIDACGLADTCETEVTITLNSPPVASATWGGEGLGTTTIDTACLRSQPDMLVGILMFGSR